MRRRERARGGAWRRPESVGTAATATSSLTNVAASRVRAVTRFKGISDMQKFALWQVSDERRLL
ncbi:hypothetical protein SORBI_3004G328200 [Sorghum bicolor]|uniref:Uncharacterized protein n=1 Tax=Sorghum bicolor TaxID=4558 RepID=A0A194YSW0_SORBI|nr:hypothetical protein SORBI_3004G328200 [Sorghum bicolor]